MDTPLTTIRLEQFAHLFKDAAAFREFADALAAAAEAPTGKLLLAGEQVVGALVFPDTMAEQRDRVLRRLLTPAAVDTLLQRFDSDELVS